MMMAVSGGCWFARFRYGFGIRSAREMRACHIAVFRPCDQRRRRSMDRGFLCLLVRYQLPPLLDDGIGVGSLALPLLPSWCRCAGC